MRTIWIVALLAACQGTEGTGFQERAERRMAWNRLGITDYTLTTQRTGFGTGRDVRVTVRDRAITGAVYLDDNTTVDRTEDHNAITIDGAFDAIDDALDEGAVKLNVTYDATRNFPTLIAVDPDDHTADEEYAYKLRDLTTE